MYPGSQLKSQLTKCPDKNAYIEYEVKATFLGETKDLDTRLLYGFF
jgi:hypothetical protein